MSSYWQKDNKPAQKCFTVAADGISAQLPSIIILSSHNTTMLSYNSSFALLLSDRSGALHIIQRTLSEIFTRSSAGAITLAQNMESNPEQLFSFLSRSSFV